MFVNFTSNLQERVRYFFASSFEEQVDLKEKKPVILKLGKNYLNQSICLFMSQVHYYIRYGTHPQGADLLPPSSMCGEDR
jgi:hypothetical protein